MSLHYAKKRLWPLSSLTTFDSVVVVQVMEREKEREKKDGEMILFGGRESRASRVREDSKKKK